MHSTESIQKGKKVIGQDISFGKLEMGNLISDLSGFKKTSYTGKNKNREEKILTGAIAGPKEFLSQREPKKLEKYKTKEHLIGSEEISLIIKDIAYYFFVNEVIDNDSLKKEVGLKRKNHVLWYHQEKGISAALNHYQRGGKSFLFNILPRGGKTVTALVTALKLKANKIILISSYPSLNPQWKAEVESLKGFEDYTFYDISKGDRLPKKLNDDDKIIVAVSLQDLSLIHI